MKRTNVTRSGFQGFVAASLVPCAAFAQGATQLNGLKPFTDCLERVKGHHEHLNADRLDAKLAVSKALTAEERAVWQRDIGATRRHAAATEHQGAGCQGSAALSVGADGSGAAGDQLDE